MGIMQGFKLDAMGKMQIGVFNEPLPEGWFDSPTKAERSVNPPEPPKRPILTLKGRKKK